MKQNLGPEGYRLLDNTDGVMQSQIYPGHRPQAQKVGTCRFLPSYKGWHVRRLVLLQGKNYTLTQLPTLMQNRSGGDSVTSRC